jgi:hypothetical protein
MLVPKNPSAFLVGFENTKVPLVMPSPTAPNPRPALPENMQTIMTYQGVEQALSSQLRNNSVGVVQNISQGLAPRDLVDESDPMQTSTGFHSATPDIETVAESASGVSPGAIGQGSGATTTDLPYPLPPRPLWPSTSEVAAQYRAILAARQRQEASPNGSTHETSTVAPALLGSMSGVINNEGVPVTEHTHNHSGASYLGSCKYYPDEIAESTHCADPRSSNLNGFDQSPD